MGSLLNSTSLSRVFAKTRQLLAHLPQPLGHQLIARFEARLNRFAVGNQDRPAGEIAARLLADGYWINTAAGIETMNGSEKQRVHQLALDLLARGGQA